MAEPVPTPDWRRLLAGFMLAPLVPALLYALIGGGDLRVLPLVLVVGVAPAVLLFALPLYLALRRRFWPTPLNLAFAGGFVAAAPWVFAGLLSSSGGRGSSGTVGKCLVEVDGVLTACGWLVRLSFLGHLALLGSLAGLIFWMIVVRPDARFNRKPRSPTAATQAPSR